MQQQQQQQQHGAEEEGGEGLAEGPLRYLAQEATMVGGFTRSYIMAPASAGCVAWLNGGCVDADSDYFRYHVSSGTGELLAVLPPLPQQHKAGGALLRLEEHAASGLFSEMNPMVICLVVQAVSFALSLGLLNDNTLILQKCALGVVLLFAGLCLFMRERWQIPQNNLLWLECILALVFVIIGSRRSGALTLMGRGGGRSAQSWTTTTTTTTAAATTSKGADNMAVPMAEALDRAFRSLISPGITTPMVSVAILALAGESDATGLLLAYAGMCGVSVLWLIEHQLLMLSMMIGGAQRAGGAACAAGVAEPPPLPEVARLIRLNAWLCLAPALVRLGMRLDALARLPDGAQPPAQWIVGALVLVLCWLLLTMVYLSLAGNPHRHSVERGSASAWFGSALHVGGHSALQWTLLLLVSICSLHPLVVSA